MRTGYAFFIQKTFFQCKHFENGTHFPGLCVLLGDLPTTYRGAVQEKWACKLQSKHVCIVSPRAAWGRPLAEVTLCLGGGGLVTCSTLHSMESGETLDLNSGLSSPGPVDVFVGVDISMPFKGALLVERYLPPSPEPGRCPHCLNGSSGRQRVIRATVFSSLIVGQGPGFVCIPSLQ